jgi:hypothetical protein
MLSGSPASVTYEVLFSIFLGVPGPSSELLVEIVNNPIGAAKSEGKYAERAVVE